MAGWDRSANWDRDVLERIVALLFALAGLADLATGAPFLRRRQVLGILNRGEAEARAFIVGMASGTAISADALEFAEDAAHLAARLRALALLLCVLLAQAPSALRVVVNPPVGQERRAVGTDRPAAPPAPDTS